MKPSLRQILIFSISLLGCTLAWSNNVDDILAENQAPTGVVFEIVSGESGLLSELIPIVKTEIIKLRKRFPKIPVAIVTHGTEQFDLTKNKRNTYAMTHKIVEELVSSDEVDVHVCGTHAEWYDVMPEDFPDYVNVSAEGPAQINDYIALGYKVIIFP